MWFVKYILIYIALGGLPYSQAQARDEIVDLFSPPRNNKSSVQTTKSGSMPPVE
jgi:hypothetical protein